MDQHYLIINIMIIITITITIIIIIIIVLLSLLQINTSCFLRSPIINLCNNRKKWLEGLIYMYKLTGVNVRNLEKRPLKKKKKQAIKKNKKFLW